MNLLTPLPPIPLKHTCQCWKVVQQFCHFWPWLRKPCLHCEQVGCENVPEVVRLHRAQHFSDTGEHDALTPVIRPTGTVREASFLTIPNAICLLHHPLAFAGMSTGTKRERVCRQINSPYREWLDLAVSETVILLALPHYLY